MRKIAFITVKVKLPKNFTPRTLTYTGYSEIEKKQELKFVITSAEELFANHVLMIGSEAGLRKEDLEINSAVTFRTVQAYIKSEKDNLKLSKSHEQA